MGNYRRMVWSEGMLLGPHHFQQAERHLLGEMQDRLEASTPHAWGVGVLEIDTEALANGRFNLARLEAILPDGTLVRLPTIDPVPTGRDLSEAFTVDRSHLDVFLALPEDRPGLPRTQMTGDGAGGASRFLGETVRLADENAPGPETEVFVARQNLRLLASGESLDGYTSIRLARVERGEDGSMRLARDFAPPSLSIAAAGPVADILRSVLENLTAQSDELSMQTKQMEDKVQFGPTDVPLYWKLHTANSHIPVLAHYQRNPEAHPFDLYLAMAGLAGALCTFKTGLHPREVPAYDHENVGPVFRRLEEMIRDILGQTVATRVQPIPLTKADDSLLKADVQDQRLFGSGFQWFLAAYGELSEDRIRSELPGQISIGSAHNVEFLVRQALRGVPITYTAIPSSDFPIKAGHVYFRLESHGETWETIAEARAIAIYIRGPELKSLSFELFVVGD